MNACRHFSNLSVAALARFRPQTQHDAPAPGYRDGVVAQRHTTASHQPGLACGSCLPGMLASAWGGREAVPVAPAATASHAVRCLCLDDGTPCTESFTLQLPSDLAAGSSMRCSSNLRSLQSNYSATVPPVASSMVPWTMYASCSSLRRTCTNRCCSHGEQFTPESVSMRAIRSQTLFVGQLSRRVMARLPSLNFLLCTLPAGANPIHPHSPSLAASWHLDRLRRCRRARAHRG
jgi:hypothetical protein